MRVLQLATLFSISMGTGFGQLSNDQKIIDFQQLASLYAKQYAPYEWKRDVIKFDLFNLKPWTDRIQSSKDDLEFYEICSEYVAALTDVHSEYYTPSRFTADLGFIADLYDGKLLIDAIDRSILPTRDFPFQAGDEIVSVDGKSAGDLIAWIAQYQSYGNTRSTTRWAAGYVGFRDQAVIPRAPEIGEKATVVINRQNGNTETYTIPWIKTGRPLISNGPVPTPKSQGIRTAASDSTPSFSNMPPYRQLLAKLQNNKRSGKVFVRGYDAPQPVFRMPAGFTQHKNVLFFSGTYTTAGLRIGYIRIPDFEPTDFSNLDAALSLFDREIKFFQTNTDGLIVDVMRNPGGFGCYAEDLVSRLVPYPFKAMGMEIRPTLSVLNDFSDSLDQAVSDGADQWIIDLLTAYKNEIQSAFTENRGLTGPLPLCTGSFDRTPVQDDNGVPYPYTKPLIVLTDEFTTSAGDIFAALMQDAQRGPIVGYRTSGAGGSVQSFAAGYYSEGSASVTQTLLIRSANVITTDFPVSNLIENIGVRPDVSIDYMTKDNLLNNGRPFVTAVTDAIVAEIKKSRQQ
jgi:C-terminal processing protease CtpA/Prc